MSAASCGEPAVAGSRMWSAIVVSLSLTHASVPVERRTQLGIVEGLVRFSCGVEDVEDLLEDMEHAFAGLD